MQYNSAITKNKPLVHQWHGWSSKTLCWARETRCKRIHTDSSMRSSRTGKNSCVVLEVRTLVASGGWNWLGRVMREPSGWWKCSMSWFGWWLHRCIHLAKLMQSHLSLKRFKTCDEIHEKRAKGALSIQGKVWPGEAAKRRWHLYLNLEEQEGSREEYGENQKRRQLWRNLGNG